LGESFTAVPPLVDPAVDQVDLDIADLQGRLRALAFETMAQCDAQARQQFADAEGLLDIVVGAGIERVDLLGLAVAGPRG
jgi:hypothetical protein